MAEHWAMKSITYTLTEAGYIIVVETFHPCHLWLRKTNIVPQEHLIHRTLRGQPILSDKRYCFVAYKDNEQSEAGDTLIHTFVKEPWAYCETRWFYFTGTIGGQPSPSTSAIFTKHKDQILAIFYPDAHPETRSVDGMAERAQPDGTWKQVHDDPGTLAWDDLPDLFVDIKADRTIDFWWFIRRSLLLFNTSPLPNTAKIISASLNLHVTYKINDYDHGFSFGVFTSFPSSNTQITPLDYQHVGSDLLSNAIAFDDLQLDAWNSFALKPSALHFIDRFGISKFSVRDYLFDALDVAPVWKPGGPLVRIRFDSSENPIHKPFLAVVYSL